MRSSEPNQVMARLFGWAATAMVVPVDQPQTPTLRPSKRLRPHWVNIFVLAPHTPRQLQFFDYCFDAESLI
jgi:hypothetical protein